MGNVSGRGVLLAFFLLIKCTATANSSLDKRPMLVMSAKSQIRASTVSDSPDSVKNGTASSPVDV